MAITACGFQPMYGDHSPAKMAHADLQKVRIAIVDHNEIRVLQSIRTGERLNQQLTNKLIDRMYKSGYPREPEYELMVNMQMEERGLGIRKDATITRAELVMISEMVLRQSGSMEELYRTTIRTRVAYNILEGQYGTLVAKENAQDRALEELANDIVTRTSLFLNRKNP
ncbi:MAG: LPS assembly lipoprotein LptE [Bdellovibrionales bacterium]